MAQVADDKTTPEDVFRASDPEKNAEPECISTPFVLDQFDDPDEGLSEEERVKKVSVFNLMLSF